MIWLLWFGSWKTDKWKRKENSCYRGYVASLIYYLGDEQADPGVSPASICYLATFDKSGNLWRLQFSGQPKEGLGSAPNPSVGQEDFSTPTVWFNSWWFLGFPGASVVRNPSVMQKTWVWSLGQEDAQEKGMATHSSTLAWRLSWTEEPGGLQSMGLQRVGYDLSD